MSGVPVYTAAPISAQKAAGSTPQTAAPAQQTAPSQPSYVPATTTASSASTHGYIPAQPGAGPPLPTSAASNRYAPMGGAAPKPTSTTDPSLPPPPQPGAVPVPPSGIPAQSSRSHLPPPPKAGEHYTPPAPQTTQPSYVPPQMSIPAPSNTFGTVGASGTATATGPVAGTSYPVPLPVGNEPRRSLEHPPGYVQNSYAQNMTADQRRASEIANAGGAYTASTLPNQNYSQGSYNDDTSGNSSKAAFGVDPDAVWQGIKGWAGVAGKKLQETEKEVWKRVNGEK